MHTISKALLTVVLVATCAFATGCGTTGEPKTGEETGSEAAEVESVEQGSVQEQSLVQGQEYEIPFANAEKLAALGLHETTFVENNDLHVDERSLNSVRVWALHDIPDGERSSADDEYGLSDDIGYGEGIFGDWAYTTRIPVGDNYVMVVYYYQSNAWEHLMDSINADTEFYGLTKDRYVIYDDDAEYPCLARFDYHPSSEDMKERKFSNYRVFRLGDDALLPEATMTVGVLTDGWIDTETEEGRAQADMFEKLCDAFGMESPFTK